jgi:polyisoprenoid-binding protein YceI
MQQVRAGDQMTAGTVIASSICRRIQREWAMRILPLLLTILPLLLAPLLSAQAEQVSLTPPAVQVEFRAYGLGLIPFDGKFTRFHGWLRYDSARPEACQVVLEIDATSLAMSNETVRDEIKGPEFMDVLRLPELAFHGDCLGEVIAGSLLLHGENHPFNLDLTRTATTITAAGKLHRAEWGMTARRFTAGSTIRIRVEIPNPAFGSRT